MPPALEIALFLHLLGVIVMVSGIVVAGAAHERARRQEGTAEIAALLGLARVGVQLAGPGTLLVLGGGFWLAHLEHLSLSTGWLSGAIGLFVLASALGAVGGQHPKRARLLAARLRDAGDPVTPELTALLDDRRARALNLASATAMLAILVLMVFKPGQ